MTDPPALPNRTARPAQLRVATLNLLNDLGRWPERSPLIVEGLRALEPHVIALQEVSLEIDNARWICDALGGYTAHVSSGTGHRVGREGLALLTTLPADGHEVLPFGAQGRIAQRLNVYTGSLQWTIANAHLHFSVYDDYTRQTQARQLLDWVPETEGPAVVCGDFNALPHYRAVATMLERFASAQSAHFGRERFTTFPTGLDRGPTVRNRARDLGLRALGRVLGQQGDHWRATVDYIFVDRRLRVLDCSVALHRSSPHDHALYASDHAALYVDVEWPYAVDA